MVAGSTNAPDNRIPFAAFVLGADGLLPFVAGAVLLVVGPTEWGGTASRALIGYGAVIPSFLGGILWGRVIGVETARRGDFQRRLLSIGVLPSLLAWAALSVDPRSGLLLLALSFVAMLAVDLWVAGRGVGPQWFPHLRVPLTVVVVGCLMVGLIA